MPNVESTQRGWKSDRASGNLQAHPSISPPQGTPAGLLPASEVKTGTLITPGQSLQAFLAPASLLPDPRPVPESKQGDFKRHPSLGATEISRELVGGDG